MGLFSSILGLGGTLLGDWGRQQEEFKENQLYEDQLAENAGINPAAVRELKAEQADRSAMNGVRADPRLRDAQLRALNGMEQVYGAGGMDPQTLAEMHQINSNVAQQDKARRDAIVASQARKGRGTGGAQYASLMSGAQSAAQSQADAAFQAHAAARQRALQAMAGSGQMAGSMRDQDVGEQTAVAQANDKISQFNANMRQQANAQNQQRDQQIVNNRLAKAGANADIRMRKADMHRGRAEGHMKRGYGYGKAAGGIVDSAMGGFGGFGG